MPLVPDGRGGREEEGAGDHGGDEGEAEEQEGMPLQRGAVGGREGVVVGFGAEGFGLEDGHGGRVGWWGDWISGGRR